MLVAVVVDGMIMKMITASDVVSSVLPLVVVVVHVVVVHVVCDNDDVVAT